MLCAGLLSVSLIAACGGALNSTTWVQPGDTFELGGGEVGAYRVTGTNTGQAAVEIVAQTSGGQKTVGVFQPGDAIDYTFQNGELAQFKNLSDTERAELKFVVRGQIDALGMKYQTPQRDKQP